MRKSETEKITENLNSCPHQFIMYAWIFLFVALEIFMHVYYNMQQQPKPVTLTIYQAIELCKTTVERYDEAQHMRVWNNFCIPHEFYTQTLAMSVVAKDLCANVVNYLP